MVEAANGQTALELAALHQGNLRLVVTDIHMPFMSGVEFAREFRRRNPMVPVVYMTGRTATVPTVEPNEELLRKPFTIDEFLGVVRRILAAVG